MPVVGFLRASWENKPPSWRSARVNATVQCSVDHVPHTQIKMVANYSLSPSPLLENWLARTGWKKDEASTSGYSPHSNYRVKRKRCYHLVLRRWKKKIAPAVHWLLPALKNVLYEQYWFNWSLLKPGESYDQYRTALRKLAEWYKFCTITLNEILKNQLIFGIHDAKV